MDDWILVSDWSILNQWEARIVPGEEEGDYYVER